MIVRPSGLEIRVGRFSRQLRGAGVLALPDAGLDTTRHVESVCNVPPGAGCYDSLWWLENLLTVAV
jgi:hypothetical protein